MPEDVHLEMDVNGFCRCGCNLCRDLQKLTLFALVMKMQNGRPTYVARDAAKTGRRALSL